MTKDVSYEWGLNPRPLEWESRALTNIPQCHYDHDNITWLLSCFVLMILCICVLNSSRAFQIILMGSKVINIYFLTVYCYIYFFYSGCLESLGFETHQYDEFIVSYDDKGKERKDGQSRGKNLSLICQIYVNSKASSPMHPFNRWHGNAWAMEGGSGGGGGGVLHRSWFMWYSTSLSALAINLI